MKRYLLILLLLGHVTAKSQSVGGTTTGAATYCSTTNSGFVSVTGYVGAILNWQSSTDGGATWSNITNTTPNQTYFNLAQTTCYRAVVKNGAFPADTSTIVCITIYPASVGGTLSGGGSFCATSGPGSINLSGQTGNVLYWMYSTNGGSTWTSIANTTTTESYSGITQNTIYAAVVQNGPSCPTDTSTYATFNISPTTVAGNIIGPTMVCVTGNSGVLNLTGNTGAVVNWETSTDGGTTWNPIGNTTTSEFFMGLTTTTIYHVIVQSGICPSAITPGFTVTVSPPTVPGTLSGGGTYCGVPATGTITLSGNVGGVNNWIYSTDFGATWLPISNTTTSQNYTALSTTTWYAAIVQSGMCQIDTSTIEIVNVAPQTVAGTMSSSALVCYGTNNDTLTIIGNVGNVLSWASSTDGGLTWTPIANTTTSQIYNGLTQNTLYVAIVQSGTCNIDTTNIVLISILPQNTISAGNDTTITQGQTVTLNGSGSGIAFNWTPTSTLSNPTILNPVASPVVTTVYTLSVTDINGCVTTDNVTVTVTLNQFTGMITNLFTPNGDGINDNWFIQDILNYPDNEVFVYNLYGNVVYNKKGYTNDWAGTYNNSELPDGTYFYVVKFEKTEQVFKGSVDILRKK